MLSGCVEIPDGTALILHLDGILEADAIREVESVPPVLPPALGRAGLSPAQWEAVWELLVAAETDTLLQQQPGALAGNGGSAGQMARRTANVAWYHRHQKVPAPAVAAALGTR